MIDEDIRHIIERQLDSDETLVWLTKSKGVWINRLALSGLILALFIAYFLQVPIFVKVIFFFIIIYSVIAVFSPFFSCLLYTSPSPRDQRGSRMPSSA